MLRILVGFVSLTMIVALSACSGGSSIQQQSGDTPGLDQSENTDVPNTGDGSGGNVSEDTGGELDPPESFDDIVITTGDLIDTVYIPYVEDVSIPDTIIAGQSFRITVTLSTAMHPELLNGISREFALPHEQYSGDTSIGLVIYLGDNTSEFEPVYDHTVEFYYVFVREEKDTLRIYTADSPEWGGLDQLMNLTQGTFFHHGHEHLTYREYPITVLPAEE